MKVVYLDSQFLIYNRVREGYYGKTALCALPMRRLFPLLWSELWCVANRRAPL